MVSKEFFKQIEIVAQEKGISEDELIEAFKKGLMNAYKRTYGHQSAEVQINPEKHEILIISKYMVVSEISEEQETKDDLEAKDEQANDISKENWKQILYSDAKKISSKAKLNKVLEVPVNPKEFGRFAASIAKQVFNQTLKTIEKDNAYNYFKEIEDCLITAVILQKNEQNMILDIGKNTTTILPDKQATPNDFTNYNEGDKILVYITSVEKTTKGPRVYVSRIDTKFVKRLFEQNIPEVKDQIIEIMGIAREAGEKTKIGLKSKDINVEAIGSCVGEKGNRIKNIVNLLDGEKIEMFKWDDDPKTLITNALYPAKVHSFANLNINKKQALVVVEDNFYQAAMGYKGINKKLVSAATSWSIEIKTVSYAINEGLIFE